MILYDEVFMQRVVVVIEFNIILHVFLFVQGSL